MKKISWIAILCMFFLSTIVLVEAVDRKGKSLFEKKCANCHPLKLPLKKNKSPEKWANTVLKMQSKMRFLTDEEMKLIITYLTEIRPVKSDDENGRSGIEALDNSFDLGKRLFEDVRLGSNGKSCASCHSDKKNSLRKKAYLYPKYFNKAHKVINLEQRVNYCIMINMEGEALRLGSDESIALTVFLYSLI